VVIAPDLFALAFKLHHAAFDVKAAWEVINASRDVAPYKGTPGWDDENRPSLAVEGSDAGSLAVAGSIAMQRQTMPLRYARTFTGRVPIALTAITRHVRGLCASGQERIY